MKVSFNWLKEYVDIKESPETLAEKLTRAGIPVEYLIYPGEKVVNVITGKVVDIYRHPDADKLWVCKIDVKGEEILQIVTGADNVTKDAIVPVAQVGAVLPNGIKIKKGKLRGLDSAGMLCSASELGIEDKLLQPEERSGIFILPADTPIGVDAREVLGLNDVIFEFELTANRGDCMNIIGIAREVAAITGEKLKLPDTTVQEQAGELSQKVEIEIADSDLCPRFTARNLTDIKIEPSPMWLQNRLRACDMRPISNVVDVTNYVMLEMGQPMHAYDSQTLTGNKVVARPSVVDEKLITLDDNERKLDLGMVVIADSEKAIGLGGVMGGLQTEISKNTKYVFLEAACFDPVAIRKTSRALGLRSEASSRFEHGIDRENILNALDRAVHLLEKIGACKTFAGRVDNYPNKYQQVVITTTQTAINKRLGTDIALDKMVDILKSLGFIVKTDGEKMSVTVPSWRNDVLVAADISEEIARINGYDNIVGTLPSGDVMQGKQSPMGALSDTIRNCMCAAGCDEVIGYSFNHEGIYDKLNLAQDDKLRVSIPILNPITDEFKVMRTTLAGSILSTMEYNIARRNEDLAIFEIGRTYISDKVPFSEFPEENTWLCVGLSGKRNEMAWNLSKENVDFYDIKGLLEELLEKLNITDYTLEKGATSYLHPGKSAKIIYQGETIGYLGEVHPQVIKAFDLNKASYLLELNLQKIVNDACQRVKYQSLPKYPEIYRDLSMLAPIEASHQTIVQTIEKSAGKLLKSVQLFDLYTGKQIEQGFKSMAYALSFQAADRTLVDEDVDKAIKNIITALETELNVKLRA